MRWPWAVALGGCRGQAPEGEDAPKRVAENPPVILSIEYPNALNGGIPGRVSIHVRNESARDISVLPDFAQAGAMGWFKVAVRDADGHPLKQVRPFINGPPLAPEAKDYLTIKPSAVGRVEFMPGVVVRAYDLKPGRLYYFDLILKMEGVDGGVKLVTPFGYAKN